MTHRLASISLLVLASIGSSAGAAIPTFMASVPISPQAIAADPVLSNHQTWDLRITVPPGEHWGYTGFLAELTQGTFYNPELGHQIPLPNTWGVFPQLRYDTFVTHAADPDDDSTFTAPTLYSGYPNVGSPIEFTDTRTSVVFVGLPGVLTGPGTFTVARLTFTDDAQGSIIGFTGERLTGEETPFGFPLPIPEPGACAGVAAALCLMLRRKTAGRSAGCTEGG